MLVTLWTADTGRFTRDIDFLAFGSDEEAELRTAFSQILATDGDDGLVYDIESLTAVAIREDQIYGGMRLRTEARLGALLHKSAVDRTSLFPRQTYPATSVTGVPRAVKPLSTATRTWNSAT